MRGRGSSGYIVPVSIPPAPPVSPFLVLEETLGRVLERMRVIEVKVTSLETRVILGNDLLRRLVARGSAESLETISNR